MHRREFLLSATGIVGATTVGSIAYTNATVTRGVSSNIAADSSAVIDLEAGAVSAVTETDGQLEIDTTGSSSGLNGNATFTYGKSESPTTNFAFSVTNNDGSSHDLTVELLNMGSLPANSSFTVTFYDDTGTEAGTADPNNDFSYTGWSNSEALYALVDIETTDATSSNDFSGEIKFSASPDTS